MTCIHAKKDVIKGIHATLTHGKPEEAKKCSQEFSCLIPESREMLKGLSWTCTRQLSKGPGISVACCLDLTFLYKVLLCVMLPVLSTFLIGLTLPNTNGPAVFGAISRFGH